MHTVTMDDDAKAGFLAALDHIDNTPAGPNIIDTMSDDEWHSDEPDGWQIEAGK